MTNSIFWGNTAPEEPEISRSVFRGLEVTFSDVRGGWPGEGNIDADPLFFGSGTYHLRPGSPCIDAGTDAGVDTDMDGQSRPRGGGFDIGADEVSLEPCSVLAVSGRQFAFLYMIPALLLFLLGRRSVK